ncbi:MAG: hypothetical protein V2B19_10000 [Pseudomonadota bacterium]
MNHQFDIIRAPQDTTADSVPDNLFMDTLTSKIESTSSQMVHDGGKEQMRRLMHCPIRVYGELLLVEEKNKEFCKTGEVPG